jgi:hypothetical protein
MRKRFLRTLLVVGALQFVTTRARAGNAVEEGAAERMWMLYPVNVLINAVLWTLMIAAVSRAFAIVRGR